LIRQAAEQQVLIVSGVIWRPVGQGDPIYHNSLVAFGADQGQYHKNRLVPFGEYIPWSSQLRGLIAFFDLPMSDFRLPPTDQGLLTNGTTPLAASICYEIAYPSLIARTAYQGGAILTVSNDSWFDQSAAPWQHLQMARLRALENGRPLIRATNSGVSALIDHHGQIITMAKPFVRTELSGHITLQQGRTPFSYWHNWPILLGSLGLLLALYLRQRHQHYTS
jgi:apolipoprotein N-acyltransferase